MSYIDSLIADVKFVKDRYPSYDVLGAFLYGSQNYNLDTDDSDVDSIVVLVPSIKLLLCEKEVSTTYELEDHHIVVKDLKAFNKNLLTLSPMAVEPLFSQQEWINDKYKHIYQSYYQNYAQEIALACPAVFYDKIRAMVKAMTRRDSLTGKQYIHCCRLVRLLQQLAAGEDYRDAMWIPEAEAQKTAIEAEAQANANKMLAESLSDALIRYQEMQKWNGELPQYVGGETAIPVLNNNK